MMSVEILEHIETLHYMTDLNRWKLKIKATEDVLII